jgi:hypothetical protein
LDLNANSACRYAYGANNQARFIEKVRMPTGYLVVVPRARDFYLSLNLSLYVNDELRQLPYGGCYPADSGDCLPGIPESERRLSERR